MSLSPGRYAELFDYNTHSDRITAGADAGISTSAHSNGVL